MVCDLLCGVVCVAVLFVCACALWVRVRLLWVNTSCVCVRVCEFVCDVVLRLGWGVLFMLMCVCVLCIHMCVVNDVLGVRVRLVLFGEDVRM